MNQFHPDSKILARYASGDLSEKSSLVISSHVSQCVECQTSVAQHESSLTQAFIKTKFNMEPDLSAMLNYIVTSRPAAAETSPRLRQSIKVNNQTLELPLQLSSIHQNIGPWRQVGKKISYAKIDVDGPSNLYLVYFAKGAKIPEHGHEGNEFAYVIAGSFTDQTNDYVSGDFVSFDTLDSHHPQTDDPDGCLLLVCIEAPFVFKEGFARLLNPFRRLLF